MRRWRSLGDRQRLMLWNIRAAHIAKLIAATPRRARAPSPWVRCSRMLASWVNGFTVRNDPPAFASARSGDFRFSNRPFGVKRFQTIHHHCSVDVARGLVLLFGIGTRALPAWDSRTRWNNLSHGLAVRRTAGPSGHAISPHPSSREGHHSTARWSSSFLLSDVILHSFQAATA